MQRASDDYLRLVEIVNQAAVPEKVSTLTDLLDEAENVFRRHDLPESQCQRLREAVYRLSTIPGSDWLGKLARLGSSNLEDLPRLEQVNWPIPMPEPFPPRARSRGYYAVDLEDHSNPEVSPTRNRRRFSYSTSLPELSNNTHRLSKKKKRKPRKHEQGFHLKTRSARSPSPRNRPTRRFSSPDSSSSHIIPVKGFDPNSAVKKALGRKSGWNHHTPMQKHDPDSLKKSVTFASPSFEMRPGFGDSVGTPSPILLAQDLNPTFTSQTPTPHEVYTPSPTAFLNDRTPATPELWNPRRRQGGLLRYPAPANEGSSSTALHPGDGSWVPETRGILTMEDLESVGPTERNFQESFPNRSSQAPDERSFLNRVPSAPKHMEGHKPQHGQIRAAEVLFRFIYFRKVFNRFKKWKLLMVMERTRDQVADIHHTKKLLRKHLCAWKRLNQQAQLPESVKIMALFRWILHQLLPCESLMWLTRFEKCIQKALSLQAFGMDLKGSGVLDHVQIAEFAAGMFRKNAMNALFTHWRRWVILQQKGGALGRRRSQLRFLNSLVRLSAQGKWWRARMQKDMDCRIFLRRLYNYSQNRRRQREEDYKTRLVSLKRACFAIAENAGIRIALRRRTQLAVSKIRLLALRRALEALAQNAQNDVELKIASMAFRSRRRRLELNEAFGALEYYSRQQHYLKKTVNKAKGKLRKLALIRAMRILAEYSSRRVLLRIGEEAVKRRLRTLASSRALGKLAENASSGAVLKIAHNAVARRIQKQLLSRSLNHWCNLYQLRKALTIIMFAWWRTKGCLALKTLQSKSRLSYALALIKKSRKRNTAYRALKAWRQQHTVSVHMRKHNRKENQMSKRRTFHKWVSFYRQIRRIRQRFQIACISWIFNAFKDTVKGQILDREFTTRANVHFRRRFLNKLQNRLHRHRCREKVHSGHVSILKDEMLKRCLQKWSRKVRRSTKARRDSEQVWAYQASKALHSLRWAVRHSRAIRGQTLARFQLAKDLHSRTLLSQGFGDWMFFSLKKRRLQKQLAHRAISHRAYVLSACYLQHLRQKAQKGKLTQKAYNRSVKILRTLKKQQYLTQWSQIQKLRSFYRKWVPKRRLAKIRKVFHAIKYDFQRKYAFQSKMEKRDFQADLARRDACFFAWRKHASSCAALKARAQRILRLRQDKIQRWSWQEWLRRARVHSRLRVLSEAGQVEGQRRRLLRHWRAWHRQRILLIEIGNFHHHWTLRRGFKWIKGNKHKQRQLLRWTSRKKQRRDLKRAVGMWREQTVACKPWRIRYLKGKKYWINTRCSLAFQQWKYFQDQRKVDKRLYQKVSRRLQMSALRTLCSYASSRKASQEVLVRAASQQSKILLRCFWHKWGSYAQDRGFRRNILEWGYPIVHKVLKKAAFKRMTFFYLSKYRQRSGIHQAQKANLGTNFRIFVSHCRNRITQGTKQRRAEDLAISTRLQQEATLVLYTWRVEVANQKRFRQNKYVALHFAKKQALWRWRMARVERHLYRVNQGTLVPIVFHRWKSYTKKQIFKFEALELADRFYQSKKLALFIQHLQGCRDWAQTCKQADLHFKRLAASSLFPALRARVRMQGAQRFASKYFQRRCLRTGFDTLHHQVVELHKSLRWAHKLGRKCLLGRIWLLWKKHHNQQIHIQELVLAVKQIQHARILKQNMIKIQNSFKERQYVKKSVVELFIGSRKRMWSDAIQLWRRNTDCIRRLDVFVEERLLKERQEHLQTSFNMMKLYYEKYSHQRNAFKIVWVSHAKKVLAASLSRWQQRLRIMDYVHDVMGQNRWGRVLSQHIFRRWASYTKTQRAIVTGARSRYSRIPMNHIFRQVGPIFLHTVEAKAFRSWAIYFNYRKQRACIKVQGDRYFFKRRFKEHLRRWKKWLSRRKCDKICTHYWKTRVKEKAMDILRQRTILHRRIRVKFYTFKQEHRNRKWQASFVHWNNITKCLAAERIAEKKPTLGMRRFHQKCFLSKLRYRASLSKTLKGRMEIGTEQWSRFHLDTTLDLWLAYAHEKKPLRLKKERALNKVQHQQLKNGFGLLISNHIRALDNRQMVKFHDNCHANLACRVMLRRWVRLHRKKHKMDHKLDQLELWNKKPHHPLRWVMTRLKKHTLEWNRNKLSHAIEKADVLRLQRAMHSLLCFVLKAQKNKFKSRRAVRIYEKRIEKPCFTKLLMSSKSRQRKRDCINQILEDMQGWRLQKCCRHWFKVARKLKRESTAKDFSRNTILDRCFSGWSYYTKISLRCSKVVHYLKARTEIKQLQLSLQRWHVSYKVNRASRLLQKRRFLRYLEKNLVRRQVGKYLTAFSLAHRQRQAIAKWVAGIKRQRLHLAHMLRLILHAWAAYKDRMASARAEAEARFQEQEACLLQQVLFGWQDWMKSLLEEREKMAQADTYFINTLRKALLVKLSQNCARCKYERFELNRSVTHRIYQSCSRAFSRLEDFVFVQATHKELDQRAANHNLFHIFSQSQEVFLKMHEDAQCAKIKRNMNTFVKKESLKKWKILFRGNRMFALMQKISTIWLLGAFKKWFSTARYCKYVDAVEKLLVQRVFRQLNQGLLKMRQLRLNESVLYHSSRARSKQIIWGKWKKMIKINRFNQKCDKRLTCGAIRCWQKWANEARVARLLLEKKQAEQERSQCVVQIVNNFSLHRAWALWISEFERSIKIKHFISKMAKKRELSGVDFKLKRQVLERWKDFSKGLTPDFMSRCLQVYIIRRKTVLENWKKAVVVEMERKEKLVILVKAKLNRQEIENLACCFQWWLQWARAFSFSERSLSQRCIKHWHAKTILRRKMRWARTKYYDVLLSKVLFYWWSFTAARNHQLG